MDNDDHNNYDHDDDDDNDDNVIYVLYRERMAVSSGLSPLHGKQSVCP